MEELKMYRVTKPSSDGTVQVGNNVWLSKNGDLNFVEGKGWLPKDEWNNPGTNDFEVEDNDEYSLRITSGREIVIKSKKEE